MARKWFFKLFTLLLFAIFLVASCSMPTDGSQNGGGSGDSEGSVEWRYKTNSYIQSSPAIGPDGTIYISSYDGYLYAIDPNTHDYKWKFQLTGGGSKQIHSSPAVGSDGTVYVAGMDWYIYAIKPDSSNPNGYELKWSQYVGASVRSSPAIGSDGTIYVAGRFSSYYYSYFCLYAFYPDGTKKWESPTGDAIKSSPAIGPDGTIYVGDDLGYVYAIDPTNGNKKWSEPFQTGGPIESSPAIGSDGTIYVGSDDGYVYAIKPDGTSKWQQPYKANAEVRSSPAIGQDGTIYVGDDAGYIHAINPTNGSKKWSHKVSNYAVQSGPAVGSDGKIYVCSDNLYVFESNGNYTIYSYPVAGDYVEQSSPAIGNKILYVGSQEGYLYAISVSSSGLANTSWPKFRQNNRNTGK